MNTILKKRKLINQKQSTAQKLNLKRQCKICKLKMHQDNLNDHLFEHYFVSNKCFVCDKTSSNQTNYVTHYLSHIDEKQFICVKCDKWFRQPVIYKRHIKTECNDEKQNTLVEENDDDDDDDNDTDTNLPNQLNKNLKRKNSTSSSNDFEPSSNSKKRKNLQVINSVVNPLPRPKGRPPKHPVKHQNKMAKKQQIKQENTKNKRELRGRKPANYKIMNQDDGFETVEEESSNNTKTKIQTRGNKTLKTKSSIPINDKPVKTSLIKPTRSSTRKQITTSIDSSSKNLKKESDNIQLDEDESKDKSSDSSASTSTSNEDDLKDLNVSDYEMEEDDNSNTKTTSQPPPPLPNISIKSTKDLSAFGTYKVKITRRRPSNNNNNNKPAESSNNNESNVSSNFHRNLSTASLLATPQKLSNLELILSTPSKNDLKQDSISSTNPNETNLNSSIQFQSFECPECEKKFVSYYGLVQHYDQHPNLAVTCVLCEITFENHQSLVQHNTNVHHLIEKSNCLFNKDKENLLANNQLLSRKPIAKDSTSTTAATTSKKSKNLTTKSKSQQDDIVNTNESSQTNNTNHDLSALPSIMTRTSRLGILNNRIDSTTNSNNLIIQSAASIKASLTSSAAILNHTLTVKTSGFADLSFIDFSCINFPRIAQNYCELWPRNLVNNNYNPLHNYKCESCGFYFPSLASLELHKIMKDKSTMRNDCQLFMTNSKYLDYEKTLNEIIDKIDSQTKPENKEERDKDEFMKWFGLINSNKLTNVSNKVSNINNKIIKTLKLEQYVNSDNNKELIININSNNGTKNSNQQLYSKLRKQMLGINHQFIKDLDRWKLMHLKPFSSNDYDNKVHLKPVANLNRPILIKSKKLKRNNNSFVTNNNNNNSTNTNNNNNIVKFPQIQTNKLPSVSNSNNNNNNNNSQNKNIIENQNDSKKNNNNNKKRKLEQTSQNNNNNSKDSGDSDKETINPARAMAALSFVDKNSSNSVKKIKSNENEIPSSSSPTQNLEINLAAQIKKAAKKKELKRLQHDGFKKIEPAPLTSPSPTSINTGNNNNNNSNSNNSKNKIILPKPPPLYKAPTHPNHHPNLLQNSSANSSILARASGMNNNLIAARNMPMPMPPKLQPMINKSVNPTPIMPKLTKTNGGNNNQIIIPQPPQLILASTGVMPPQNSNNKQLLLNGPPKLISPISAAVSVAASAQNSNDQLVRFNKNSENLSLKCKFCLQIFKGQSEFFQHVIMKHPKTLKQRLNKANRAHYTSLNKHNKTAHKPIAPKLPPPPPILNEDTMIPPPPSSTPMSSMNHLHQHHHHHHHFQSGSSSNNSNSISSTHSD